MEKRRTSDIVIGSNITNMRKKFNLTQKEVAQVLGVNLSTYKHYELGDRLVPLDIISDLSKFYKISSNYFFENMPELSIKEQMEVSNFMHKLQNNREKYIVFNPKGIKKTLEDTENKVQARARLRIRNYRQSNNKSQQEIADYLNIDISTYNKYEKGSRKLNNEVVRKIAEYYNINVSDILD